MHLFAAPWLEKGLLKACTNHAPTNDEINYILGSLRFGVESGVRIHDDNAQFSEFQLVLQHYRGLRGLAGDDDDPSPLLERTHESA